MLDVLPAIFQFLLTWFTSIFNVYVTSSILCGFFTLWLIDRAFGIFDILKR